VGSNICLIYPTVYLLVQLCMKGPLFLMKRDQLIDNLHVCLGYYNIFTLYQISSHDEMYNINNLFECKVTTILQVFVSLYKMFEFLKVIKQFSYIVTMILQVMSDIRVFLLFFFVMTLFLSMIFNVISPNEAPEYRNVTKFWANFLNVMRLALGDFGFDLLSKHDNPELDLNYKQHIMFWILWLGMVLFSSLVFMNFIIAEVCSSYEHIN